MLEVVEYFDIHVVGRTVESNKFAKTIFVVVFISEFEDWFSGFLAQPNNSATSEFVVPLARGDEPRARDASESACRVDVEEYGCVGVHLEE